MVSPRITIWCCALALTVAPVLRAADGDLDTRFGVGGQLSLPRGSAPGLGNVPTGGLALIDEHHFQLVMRDAHNNDLHVYRVGMDGQRDPNFGPVGDGHLRIIDCLGSRRSRIAIDAQKRAVLWTGACLMRLNADGGRDGSFSEDGVVPVDAGTNAIMVLDESNRALLVGADGGNACVATRVLPDGTTDASFGTAGRTQIAQCQPATIALRRGGRLLIGDGRDVIALDASGHPDATFGIAGRATIALPPGVGALFAGALAADRRDGVWFAANSQPHSGASGITVARLDSAGAPDVMFGVRNYPFVAGANITSFGEVEMAIAQLPSYEVLVSFSLLRPTQIATRTDFALLRLRGDGTADTDFGVSGIRYYDMPDLSGQGRHASYDQLHATVFAPGTALMLGRTMFEDTDGMSDLTHPISLMKVNFDRLFGDGLEVR